MFQYLPSEFNVISNSNLIDMNETGHFVESLFSGGNLIVSFNRRSPMRFNVWYET